MAFIFVLMLPISAKTQSYTSYFTGNQTDVVVKSSGGICMMGGARENDEAMRWFLRQANEGDVLVLRASGADGYNQYLFSELGVKVNAVETIVFHQNSAANEPYIQQKIRQAEAIWMAGGNQWNYVSYWGTSPIGRLINEAIAQRNVVIGGTSAGMAVLGRYYFSAEKGTVSSENALLNPFNTSVTVDSTQFLKVPFLNQVITDTHYDNPSRKGRHMVFMSRIFSEFNPSVKGIAADEFTSVVVEKSGLARVYGEYPARDDTAYFIQTNCEQNPNKPEILAPGMPLTWYVGGAALKVYAVRGTINGTNSFDLKDWKTGNGGVWMDWSVQKGIFVEKSSGPMLCSTVSINQESAPQLRSNMKIFPNPTKGIVHLAREDGMALKGVFKVYDVVGKLVKKTTFNTVCSPCIMDVVSLKNGTYFLQNTTQEKVIYQHKFVKY